MNDNDLTHTELGAYRIIPISLLSGFGVVGRRVRIEALGG